jgi:proteasome lid subunit RPN8/RPN11
MQNIAASPTSYRIDDSAHIKLRRLLRDIEPPLSIAGVYHSHPAGDAAASPTDIKQAMYPEWLYLIVGLKPPKNGRRRGPELRAFQIRNGRARAVAISWF